jgi:tetratricopeptide (TPR) repeat protein
MSAYEARHLLARLYARSDTSLDLAVTQYRRLLAERAGDPDVSIELAEVLVRLGRRAEASTLLATLDAADPRVAAGLGDAFFASGRMAEAADAYDRARKAGSARTDLPLLLAQSLSWSGQAGRALPYLETLYAADPEQRDVGPLYARALAETGDRVRARQVLDEIAARSPDDAAVLLELADMEAALGHVRASRDYSLRALALDDSPGTRLRVARNMNQWGAFHRAIALHRDRLARGADRETALALAETLSNAQRYEEAEGVLEGLLLRDRADRDALAALAEVMLRQKDGRAALVVVDRLSATGDDPRVVPLRARALALLGRWSESAALWGSGADADPARLIEQGRMLAMAGDDAGAADAFARALRLAPANPGARYHAALSGRKGGVAPSALQLAREVAATESDPVVLVAWGEVFSANGRYDAAIVCLQAAITRDPESFPARLGLAENLAYDQRYDAALAELKALEAAYPDSSKILLTRARVLAWSRSYDEAMAVYETLHADDPSDPVPLREMARTAFWDKRVKEGQAAFARLLDPPVDELLAERLEAEQAAGDQSPELAEAARDARQSALNGGLDEAYARLADSDLGRDNPQLLVPLIPAYHIQRAAALESRAKTLAYNRRFAPAISELSALTDLRPGNEEAWFDLGQARCALGLCADETLAYARLLEIDPQHALAARALERRRLRNAPTLRAGTNLWEEKGHGNLANIVRLRNDLEVSMPVSCGLRVDATAHQWQEMPQSPSAQYDALGGTLGVSGVFNEWLSGRAAWTAKRFGGDAPDDTDQFRTRLELNLRDVVRLGFGFERVDEVANRFALLQGTQSDNVIVDARMPLTRRLDLEGGVKFIRYSDDNGGEAAHLQAGYALTDHPRIFRIILRGDYRHTDHVSTELYTAGELTDIVHPYWTPQSYLAGAATLEWYADLADDFFCGAERHFLDLKLTGGTDSDTNNSIEFEAEWKLDFADHWGVEARGLIHRSPDWDANGLWTGVRYGF